VKGTTTLTGCVGQLWADAQVAVNKENAAFASVTLARTLLINICS
jgi:hypothetical protein